MKPRHLRHQHSPARRSWRRLQRLQLAVHGAILALAALSLVPAYLMVSWSFKNPLQYMHQRWIPSFPLRLGNYSAAWGVLRGPILNTLLVAVAAIAGVLVLSLTGGYVFARMRFPFKEELYYAIIALLMVPWILSFVPSYLLYYAFGLLNSRWVLIIPAMAWGPVFGIFLLRAFIAGIPEELYEAARCDGAGVWTLIVRITLPLSLPALATLAVLNFISTWNSFLWPLVTITDRSKQVAAVALFQMSRQVGVSIPSLGPLFAGYTIASLPLVILFFFLGRFYVEGLVESGLKV